MTLGKLVAADNDSQETGGYCSYYLLCIKGRGPQAYSHARRPLAFLAFPPSLAPQVWVLGYQGTWQAILVMVTWFPLSWRCLVTIIGEVTPVLLWGQGNWRSDSAQDLGVTVSMATPTVWLGQDSLSLSASLSSLRQVTQPVSL